MLVKPIYNKVTILLCIAFLTFVFAVGGAALVIINNPPPVVGGPIVQNTADQAAHFTHTTTAGAVTITGLASSHQNLLGLHVNIPSTIGGNPVRAIGDSAFTVAHVVQITMPDTLTTIGHAVLGLNRMITNIVIPNSVNSIHHSAFSQLPGLTSVTLPTGLPIDFTAQAFQYSPITTINFAGSATFRIENNSLVRNSDNTLVMGAANLHIPSTATSIGASAFSERQGPISSLTIPNNITSIGSSAFRGNKIESIVLPTENVSSGAFWSNQISSIIISTPVPNFIQELGWIFMDNPVTSITVNNLPSGFTIANNTITRNSNNEIIIGALNAHIPTGTQIIGGNAFSGRGISGTITIPSSVTTVDMSAFRDNQITNVIFQSTGALVLTSNAFSHNQITVLTLPSGVVSGDGGGGILGASFTHNPIHTINLSGSLVYTVENNTVMRNIGPLTVIALGASNAHIPSVADFILAGAFVGRGIVGAVTIPDHIISTQFNVFQDNLVEALTLQGSIPLGMSFENLNLSSVVIPATVNDFAFSLFTGNPDMTFYTELLSAPSAWGGNWQQRNWNRYHSVVLPSRDIVWNALPIQASLGGAVTPGALTAIPGGATRTITATPNAGQTFRGWTVISGTATIADPLSPNTTVTIHGNTNATIQANFGYPWRMFTTTADNTPDNILMNTLFPTQIDYRTEIRVGDWVKSLYHGNPIARQVDAIGGGANPTVTLGAKVGSIQTPGEGLAELISEALSLNLERSDFDSDADWNTFTNALFNAENAIFYLDTLSAAEVVAYSEALRVALTLRT